MEQVGAIVTYVLAGERHGRYNMKLMRGVSREELLKYVMINRWLILNWIDLDSTSLAEYDSVDEGNIYML